MVSVKINPNKDISTKGLASEIADILGASSIQQRESSNYPPEEEYFKLEVNVGEVKVYRIDDGDSEKFPFCATLSTKGAEAEEMSYVEELSQKLKGKGYSAENYKSA